MTIADASALVGRLRAAGRTVVFTNGVFDLLHIGHLRYLRHARTLGDALLVGVNSDRSVRAIKGPGRPITSETEPIVFSRPQNVPSRPRKIISPVM